MTLNFVKCFISNFLDKHVVFLIYSFDIVNHNGWFLKTELLLVSQDKSRLVMMYDSFYINKLNLPILCYWLLGLCWSLVFSCQILFGFGISYACLMWCELFSPLFFKFCRFGIFLIEFINEDTWAYTFICWKVLLLQFVQWICYLNYLILLSPFW